MCKIFILTSFTTWKLATSSTAIFFTMVSQTSNLNLCPITRTIGSFLPIFLLSSIRTLSLPNFHVWKWKYTLNKFIALHLFVHHPWNFIRTMSLKALTYLTSIWYWNKHFPCVNSVFNNRSGAHFAKNIRNLFYFQCFCLSIEIPFHRSSMNEWSSIHCIFICPFLRVLK